MENENDGTSSHEQPASTPVPPSSGSSRRGRRLSEEHKEKIRRALRGRHLSEETKDRISRAQEGRVFTPEHREKLKGVWTPERRARLSETMKRVHAEKKRRDEEEE